MLGLMPRRILLVAATAALLAAPAAAHAQAPLLEGTTGPGFTISLTKDGAPVKKLAPGTYRFRIDDRSGMHDFALRGPGISRQLTGIGQTGRKTVTLTLRAGRYTYLCTPHASSMRGSFVVR